MAILGRVEWLQSRSGAERRITPYLFMTGKLPS
jgi:hypothetical protein